MGLLNLWSRHAPEALLQLPSGTFTVDRQGHVITSTLPSSFPVDQMEQIARRVLDCFAHAQELQLPLTEIIVQFAALKVQARRLRSGAIVFLRPVNFAGPKS